MFERVVDRRSRSVVPRGLALAGAVGACAIGLATTFPNNPSVYFQTSGCYRGAGIGDWYTANNSASTVHYGEFFLEVTESMAPATVVVVDAESTAGVGPNDEVTGASDTSRFELRDATGTTVLQATTVNSGAANGTNVTFSLVPVGLYRIRSYLGSDMVPALATGAYCDQAVGDNDDDNGFQITVNGAAAIDGLLGYLQTSYQHSAGGTINYQMYFMVGPDSADTTLQLRNFDLDGGATSTQYNRTPNATGTAVAGTVSGGTVWNGAGGTLNTGQDNVVANNDLASGALEAGTWGYRINGWTTNNQTIFEANNTGIRLALSDVLPTRGGFFTITPTTTLATTIGNAVHHPFTIVNLFFTNDLINLSLSGTSANYTVLLMSDAACDGVGDVALTDLDSNGQVDTGLMTAAGTAGATECFTLRVTPNAGASTSDTTRISAVSLMDSRIGAGNTTRTLDKVTLLPPIFAKAFSPDPIGISTNSTLTFTLSNPNTVAITGAAFSDTYPADLDNAATPAVSNACGGSTTGGVAGADTIGLSAGTIPAAGSCTVSVAVTSALAGSYANVSGALTTTNAGSGGTANATLTVAAVAPPSVSKAFAASPIVQGGTTMLTLTLTNPNGATALTGLAISDTYPAGLVNHSTPAPATTCPAASITGGVAAGSTIGITGGTLAAGASCTVTVVVSSATAAGYLNSTGAVSSTNGGLGNTASATLVVHARPTISKAFAASPIGVGTQTVLTITLTNPNSSAMTNAAFTDTYPAGLVNAGVPNASSTCSGTVTAVAAAGSVALSSGVIPANSSCNVQVTVTSAAAATYNNTIAAGGLTTNGGISNTAAANASLTVQVIQPPVVTKTFAISPIQTNGNTTLTLVVSNPNGSVSLLNVALTDTYLANVINRTPASATITCTAGSTAVLVGGVDAGATLGLNNGSLLPGGSCTITAQVTGTAIGTYVDSSSAPTSSNGGTGVAVNGTLTVQAALVPPSISKAFSVASMGIGQVATLTFTVVNPNNAALANITMTDTYPAGLVNAATPAVASNCDNAAGGANDTTGGVAAGNTIGLAGNPGANDNDRAANTTCTVTVQVTATTEGTKNNVSGAVASTSVAGGNTASATITIARPTITKSFSPDPIASGGQSTLTLTLTNPTATAFTAAGFTDTFPISPGAMTLASTSVTNTCGGTILDNGAGALDVGDVGIRLVAGTIPANSSCTITALVSASVGGTYTNTIAAGGLVTAGGTNLAAASDTLVVSAPPTVAKAFGPGTIIQNGSSTLTITLSNSNTGALTSVSFTDTLPAGVDTTSAPSSDCGGTVTATATSVSLAGGTIPASGSCTVVITVSAAVAGSYPNTIAIGDVTSSGGSNTVAGSATLFVNGTLTAVKSSAVISDPVNGVGAGRKRIPGAVIEYTVTITNPGAAAVTLVVVSDAVPTGTTFVSGSLLVAGVTEDDDNAGADESNPNGGDYNVSSAGAITARVPSLAASASVVVVFRVTVD